MSILRIFDVSQYISSGVANTKVSRGVIQDQGIYRANEMPIAGLNVMLNVIHEFNDDNTTLVFACDGVASIKREMYTNVFGEGQKYKGNRPQKDKKIGVQRRMIVEVLEACNLNVISLDGYEGDDIMASLVDLYENVYDHIYLHTRDSDLFYLVRDNVSIEPVGNVGKRINRDNWEHTVKKDYYVPYNTLTINKLIEGELGDNIPAIPQYFGKKISDSLDPSNFEYLGDMYILRNWIAKVVDNDERVMGTLDLLIPLVVPNQDLILHDEPLNYNMYKDFCTAFSNKYFKNLRSNPNNKIVEGIIEKYLSIYHSE